MNAMQKAIRGLQAECTPIKDENDFEYYATNNIVWAMEIAIKEAKKEVFDDIENIDGFDAEQCASEYNELKKHHLSTFDKQQKP